jgi:hypothetical protein
MRNLKVFRTQQQIKKHLKLLATHRIKINSNVQFTNQQHSHIAHFHISDNNYSIISVDHIAIPNHPYNKYAVIFCGLKDDGHPPNFYHQSIAIIIPRLFIQTQTVNLHNLQSYLKKLIDYGIQIKGFYCSYMDNNIFKISLKQLSKTIIYHNLSMLSDFTESAIDRVSLKTYLENLKPIIAKQQMIQNPMQIQDMSQINRKYQTQLRQQQQRNKKIQLYYTTGNFLNYMKNAMGKLNSLIKFVFQVTQNYPLSPTFSAISCQNATKCSLLSQCYTTTQTINYYFCEPNREFNDLQEISYLINDTNIINIEISINAINGFPGHIFNIIILPNNKAFWIQSYIYKYFIQFQEIELENVQEIISLYKQLFVNPTNEYFTINDEKIWKFLTKAELKDYYNRSLIGTRKPNHYYQKYCHFSVDNLNQYLIEKHIDLLKSSIDKIHINDPNLNEQIKESFGQLQTKNNIKSMLLNSIQSFHPRH